MYNSYKVFFYNSRFTRYVLDLRLHTVSAYAMVSTSFIFTIRSFADISVELRLRRIFLPGATCSCLHAFTYTCWLILLLSSSCPSAGNEYVNSLKAKKLCNFCKLHLTAAIQLIYKESLLVVYAKKSKQFLGLRNFCLYECIVLITIICPLSRDT